MFLKMACQLCSKPAPRRTELDGRILCRPCFSLAHMRHHLSRASESHPQWPQVETILAKACQTIDIIFLSQDDLPKVDYTYRPDTPVLTPGQPSSHHQVARPVPIAPGPASQSSGALPISRPPPHSSTAVEDTQFTDSQLAVIPLPGFDPPHASERADSPEAAPPPKKARRCQRSPAAPAKAKAVGKKPYAKWPARIVPKGPAVHFV